ncbi:MAG TPA: vWA domain-containing protein [Fimbriiglobus sp.]|jgi:Ca-activated chloride channel family protein
MAVVPPGLSAAWTDLTQFLTAARFARPEWLWLGFAPLLIGLIAWGAGRRARAGASALGRPAAVARLAVGPRPGGIFARLVRGLAWVLLVIGLAGPCWGRGAPEGVSVGRDVVIVLDMSRSMWADDTADGRTRWQLAQAAALNLIDATRSNGHRVGVVVFAARPLVLVPLTTDPAYAAQRIAALDGRHPPPDVRPADDAAVSGTRIGAAIVAAVAVHDPRFTGFQDIVLVSDGDDPANDREWSLGVSAARKANIPVHTVGIGDPTRDTTILVDGDLLKVETRPGVEVVVKTRLREDVLRAIASEGKGEYLPARRTEPKLGEFFRTVIEPNPNRELTDDQLPQLKERYPWFLAPAAGLFLFVWWRRR